MQKLGFPGMKGMDHFRSVRGTLTTPARALPVASPRPNSDSVSYGSFTNLKLTAEKLLKEQASAKTTLEMTHAKLKRSEEQIHTLESKLQEAINENAKVRVKQNEDAKLWKGLDSKLSSTKMLCDQLTETLQNLAYQTRTAEDDKKIFEEKLSENSKYLDALNNQVSHLSAKLESAGRTIELNRRDMLRLVQEKEDSEKELRDKCQASEDTIKYNDVIIKQLEDVVKEDKVRLQEIDTERMRVHCDLQLKENEYNILNAAKEKLEEEKNAVICRNQELLCRMDESTKEIVNLENTLHTLFTEVVDLDKKSGVVSDSVAHLLSLSDKHLVLAQKEKDLTLVSAQGKLDKVHDQFLQRGLENDTLKSQNEELRNKIVEHQKSQEFVMVQHVEECRLAEDKIRRLESEIEVLISKKGELESSSADLVEKIKHLSEASIVNGNTMKDLLEKNSRLESENLDIQDKMLLMLKEKAEDRETFQDGITKQDQHICVLEDKINQLNSTMAEKDQLNLQFVEREKQLQVEKLEIKESLTCAERKLNEVKNQYEITLESKQLELSKHLKEISQRNDQAINEIRRKYEMEKLEIANAEIEKADKLIKEMERKCEERVSQIKEAEKHLMDAKEEHGEMISRIKQEYSQMEANLRIHHKDEMLRVQLQSENEMREKICSLRREHEIQIKALTIQHEDDYRRLQEEVELQKSKEEKQRALLQLQWKVMSQNQHDDEAHSDSSIKMRVPNGGKENKHSASKLESGKKDVDMGTPVANLLSKVKKNNKNIVGIPKHRKVTRHEYEVETLNGKTITKHKTKSTVLFGEPPPQKRARSRTPNTNNDVNRMRKVINRPVPRASVIGDLCTEGSLNPYIDDPYAFD